VQAENAWVEDVDDESPARRRRRGPGSDGLGHGLTSAHTKQPTGREGTAESVDFLEKSAVKAVNIVNILRTWSMFTNSSKAAER
jgi:hypothetical protein